MRISPRALALAAAGLTALAPAIAQQSSRPESILPPGFGEPAPAPTASAPVPVPTATPGAAGTLITVQPLPTDTPSATPSATPTPIDPAILAEYELPASARRSLDSVGPLPSSEGGLPADAFGAADGPYLEMLMRRLSAPLPSRWLSILLRRTLVSQVDTPAGVNGADFAAERAWLLLRMGESIAARAVVQGVDTGNATPKLYQVAMNAALATSDPGGLCPLADGAAASGDRSWRVAQAMCAGLAGETARAKALTAAVKRQRLATGIDLLLAQKVVGTGTQGQATTIEWAGVDRLTAWRFGLATATGVALPPELLATVGPQALGWQALSPAVTLADRVTAADYAAGQGLLSCAAMVDLYGAVDADDASTAAAAAVARDLATAYADRNVAARLAALRSLWGSGARVAYGRLVLTARAAARVPVAADVKDTDRLIASMLAAGLDGHAVRWRGAVTTGSDAWAMIALSDPAAGAPLGYGELGSYAGGGDAALKQRLFFAGLAGLGRLSPADIERAAEALDVKVGTQNSWTRALDRAAQDNEPGTVVLLAAIGMQTPNWRGVPPAMLYRIVGALRAVGLEGEARMIAAEAIARA